MKLISKLRNQKLVRAGLIGLVLVAVAGIGQHYLGNSNAAVGGSFMTRSGNKLMLDGKPFRFAGANMYWVGLDDNIRDSSGQPSYPTHFRIDNGFDAASSIGATVVRAHTIGVSVGCATCLEPSLGVFNDKAFESMDYAVQAAGKRNIKLMVPLIDQWRWYHGGKSVFTGWRGYPNNPNAGQNAGNNQTQKASEAHFYTDSTVIADYKNYLDRLLNHVNQYTGVAYKNDPTIAIWETGNEVFDAPASWTDMMANYLKQTQGVKQLVADGSAAAGKTVAEAALTSANVDIVGGHYYNWPNGLNVGTLTDQSALAANAGKAYIVGEYGWTIAGRTEFLSAIEKNSNVAGDLFWSIIPRKEDGSTVTHGTGYGTDDVSFYVPVIDAAMQTAATAFLNHATTMAGVPAAEAPKITLIKPVNNMTVSGKSVSVSAAVTAATNPVSRVDFYLDGAAAAFKSINAPGPYDFAWDASLVSNGGHTLRAVVTDSKGLQSEATSAITVTGSSLTVVNDAVTGTGTNQFTYNGSWSTSTGAEKYLGDDHYSNSGGNTAVFKFSGSTVKLYGGKAPHYGMLGVSIDGGAETMIDAYAATRSDQTLLYTSPALAGTTHTVTVRVAGTKNVGSAGTVVSIDKAEVIAGSTSSPAPTSKGDTNADNRINALDLSFLITHDGQNYPAADFNGDGTVGAADLAILLANWTW